MSARPFSTLGFWCGLAVVILLVAFVQVVAASRPQVSGKQLSFSTFLDAAERGRVRDATILDQDSYIIGSYRRPDGAFARFNVPYIKGPWNPRERLVDSLLQNRVSVRIDQQVLKAIVTPAQVVLPALIIIVMIFYLVMSFRRGTGVFGLRSGARRAGSKETETTFDDVAAQDVAITELRELAQFLSNPGRFTGLGARIPKGVLLYGPPGCGKTLLARALAGESGAAFYSISGSDFVELYVGVGAARVRDLFKEARENAPAILFIDEIDAVGGRRRGGAAVTDSNEEQGQALNQILSEMDGFSQVEGTIVVGATNRPDDLDPALLRPGRFDRAISVDRPDEPGRAAILAIHARGKPLGGDVDLQVIASRAIGLTGADLESVMNEAALLTARASKAEISQTELQDALTRIVEAPERQRRLSVRDRTVGQQSLSDERVTFADVAGADEALTEMKEIKEFLSNPDHFTEMGARFPKGFLLVGPPGCGKTLLARAVAGESNAAFLAIAATEFTEVFVGEGSGRVRDLFSQARAVAPTIVFIDEIDAIGTTRESSFDSHTGREREQTLNQILIELDGFRQRDGVIIMAATNRPEILDAALVRPGRFDRTITLGLPDRSERRAILDVHSAGKRLDPTVDLDSVANLTRGLSGADLANVMNEAALLGARKGQRDVSMGTVEEAIERATMGISRAHVLTDEERRLTAFHEAGHAMVARAVPEGTMPHMISIIPVGRQTGRAWLFDTHDRVVFSREDLIDQMAILLGGRAAEKLVFGEGGSGAGEDLTRVSDVAYEMVRELGMSDGLGAVAYGENGHSNGGRASYSEDTARIIDAEVRKLIDQAERLADEALRASRDPLDRVATALLESETLTAEQIEELAGPAPARA